MYNLPIDSAVAGNIVLHEGNHDGRGTPHENYLSKWNYHATTNNQANTNKFTKIAEINYEHDNNVNLHYILKIVSEKTSERFFVNLVLNNTGILLFNYYANPVFDIKAIYTTVGTSDSGKTLAKVELYVQLFKSYNPVYVILEFARNTDYWVYDKDYAYNCIELFKEQPLLDTIAFTNSPTDLTINDFVKTTTWGTISIPANTTSVITINDTNIKWNSIVNYSISVPVPDGLILSNAQLKSGGGTFYIKINNVTGAALSFPACTISWRVRQI